MQSAMVPAKPISKRFVEDEVDGRIHIASLVGRPMLLVDLLQMSSMAMSRNRLVASKDRVVEEMYDEAGCEVECVSEDEVGQVG